MAVNFSKNQKEIIDAWRQVVDAKNEQNWALYGYEGTTNNIRVVTTGNSGLRGLVQELNCSLIQYAYCRVIDTTNDINKLILINWQGDSAPLSRKGLCASHVGDVANYFKGAMQTLTIRNDDEATVEYIMEQIVKSSSSRKDLSKQISGGITSSGEVSSPIGSTYKRTDVHSEIGGVDRKSFWQQQEEEEKQRLAEENKRAAEKQALFERERKLREEAEARKLAETIKERDRFVEEARKAETRAVSQGSGQPMSMQSEKADEDDQRVGRRSELIRLERNQETQSLISKGSTKNKRALFEQASMTQQAQNQANLQVRRPSGTIVSQRVNTFKSLDSNRSAGTSSANSSLSNDSVNREADRVSSDRLANGFAQAIKTNDVREESIVVNAHPTSKSAVATITKQVETVKIINDEAEPGFISTQSIQPEEQDIDPVSQKTDPSTPKSNVIVDTNGTKTAKIATPPSTNLNNNHITQETVEPNKTESNDDKSKSSISHEPEVIIPSNGYGTQAKALYDYQAADNTEISFDPNDVIGYIEKIDPGWWQGTVISGQYKGQFGLFPANYVEEL